MYIEPCCIDNQLPQLLKQAPYGFVFFQTNGDVTLEKLLGAVSHMAGNEHVIILTVPEVDVMMLRTMAYYFRRGWMRALLLLTASSQRDLIEGELAGYLDRVQYAVDPLVLDGQVALMGCQTTPAPPRSASPLATDEGRKNSGGEEKYLVIQGAMLGQADFSLSLYCAWLGTRADMLEAAVSPLIAKLKTKPVIDHHEQADIARVLNRDWNLISNKS